MAAQCPSNVLVALAFSRLSAEALLAAQCPSNASVALDALGPGAQSPWQVGNMAVKLLLHAFRE